MGGQDLIRLGNVRLELLAIQRQAPSLERRIGELHQLCRSLAWKSEASSETPPAKSRGACADTPNGAGASIALEAHRE